VRIVQLNPFFFPYAGGTERRILEIGRRLARRHDVTVVTSRLDGTPREEEMDGVHIVRLPSRYRLRRWWNPPLVSTRGLDDALHGLAPDVIDFHYRWAPSYQRAFVRAGTRSRLAFTYNNTFGEGTGALRLASLANDAWTRRFIRRAHRILCVSAFVQDDLARRGFPRDRLRVAPNGIDADAARQEAGRGRIPDQLAGRRYLAAVGRLVGLKGFDVAVDALARLPPDVHLAICGQGPLHASLARRARRRGVANRLHLLGWVPEADKLRLVQEAAAFVHPARFEAFGIAPPEALAVGTPVVAAATGGLPELVGDGGYLVPVNDPVALAEAAARLLDGNARAEVGARASRRAAAYSWDAAATSTEDVYTECVTEG
jgi:glycosyltransferase involved in cell wall biosynthesis